ncbi:MAG: hypothetical protein IJ736_07405 [Firmicutes bacterium]|nr:hypothetical protein [Bacillota bacterium]
MNGYGNSKREDELIDMVTELEDENKVLHQQITDLRQQLTTSVPFSTVSILKNKIQEQADEIVSLNEWIGRLNGADLILKDNERLKAENSRLIKETESAVRQARKEVDDEKQKLGRQAMELIEAEKKVKTHQAKLDDMIANESEHIRKEAQIISKKTRKYYAELYRNRNKKLTTEYNVKTALHKSLFIFAICYGIITTLLHALLSDVFMGDLADFFTTTGRFIITAFTKVIELAQSSGELSNGIGQPILQKTVNVLLFLLPIFIVDVIIAVVIIFIIGKFLKWYREEIADYISLFAAFITFAVSTTLGEYVKIIMPMNLIVFNIMIHLMYCGLRHYIRGSKENRGYY